MANTKYRDVTPTQKDYITEETADSGTLLLYNFNYDEFDSSQNKIGGNWAGTELYATGFDGTANGAANLNGSSRINIGTNNFLTTSANVGYTMSCWVNFQSVGALAYVYYTEDPSGAQSELYLNSSNQIKFRARRGLSITTSDTIIVQGEWYHITGVYDSLSGSTFLYINGKLEDAKYGETPSLANSTTALIGADADSVNNFTGYIDDLKFQSGASYLDSPNQRLKEPISLPLTQDTTYNPSDDYCLKSDGFFDSGDVAIDGSLPTALDKLSAHGWVVATNYWEYSSDFPRSGNLGWKNPSGNGLASADFSLGSQVPINVSVWYYDDMVDSTQNAYLFLEHGANVIVAQVGVVAISTNWYAQVNDLGSNVTNVRRSKGWHQFSMISTGIANTTYYYVDGNYVGNSTNGFPDIVKVRGDSTNSDTYYDDIRIDYNYHYFDGNRLLFKDDGEEFSDTDNMSVNGWSVGNYSTDMSHTGDKCMKITASTYISPLFNSVIPAIYEVWIYDDISDTTNDRRQWAGNGSNTAQLGVMISSSSLNYSYLDGGATISSVRRTTGWHKFAIKFDGSTEGTKYYIDDKFIGSAPDVDDIDRIGVEVTGSQTLYFDDVKVYNAYDTSTEWSNHTYSPDRFCGTATSLKGDSTSTFNINDVSDPATFEGYVFDDMITSGTWGLQSNVSTGGPFGITVSTGTSTTYYCYRNASGTVTASEFRRSYGWHKFKTYMDGAKVQYFIDDIQIALEDPTDYTISSLSLVSESGNYFDKIAFYRGKERPQEKIFSTAGAEMDDSGYDVRVEGYIDSRTSGDYAFYDDAESGTIGSNWDQSTGGSYSTDMFKFGTSSIKLSSTGDMYEGVTTAESYETFFYDDMETEASKKAYLGVSATGTLQSAVGLDTATDTVVYTYYDGSSWNDSTVSRTKGWHRLRISENNSKLYLYIDDELVYTDSSFSTINRVNLFSDFTNAKYFDEVRCYTDTVGVTPKELVEIPSQLIYQDVIWSDNCAGEVNGTDLSSGVWTFQSGTAGLQQYVTEETSGVQIHSGATSIEMDASSAAQQVTHQLAPVPVGPHTFEWWMYDDSTEQTSGDTSYLSIEDGSGYTFLLGVLNATSGANYTYNDGTGLSASSITRSTGWHKFQIINTGTEVMGYIDNEQVFRVTITKSTQLIKIICDGSNNGTWKPYYDDIRVYRGSPIPSAVMVEVDTEYQEVSAYTADGSTQLLMHFDNAATDSSIFGQTVTANNITYSTGTKKIGTHAAVFNGTSSNFSFGNPHVLDGVHSGEVEMWAYFDDLTGTQYLFNSEDGTYEQLKIWMDTSGKLNFYKRQSISFNDTVTTDAAVLTATTWHHIKCVWFGTVMQIFIDGINVKESISANAGIYSLSSSPVAYLGYDGSTNYFDGNMDEFRISGKIHDKLFGQANTLRVEYAQDSTITPAKYWTDRYITWGTGNTLLKFETPEQWYQFTDGGCYEDFAYKGVEYGSPSSNLTKTGTVMYGTSITGLDWTKKDTGPIVHNLYTENSTYADTYMNFNIFRNKHTVNCADPHNDIYYGDTAISPGGSTTNNRGNYFGASSELTSGDNFVDAAWEALYTTNNDFAVIVPHDINIQDMYSEANISIGAACNLISGRQVSTLNPILEGEVNRDFKPLQIAAQNHDTMQYYGTKEYAEYIDLVDGVAGAEQDADAITTYSVTITSDAYILTTEQNTITSDAWITRGETESITSDATIYRPSVTVTITSDALISRVTTPTLEYPADNGKDTSPVKFRWRIPTDLDGNPMNCELIVDGVTYKSWIDANFTYWNNSTEVTYPTGGVDSGFYGNEAWLSNVTLTTGDYVWRVRGAVET